MSDFDTTMELAGEAALECLGTERVTYTPSGGAARTIDAVVHRLGIDPATSAPIARIKARQHATLGLDAATLNTGGDTIAWKPKRGGTAKTSRILGVISANAGFVTVEVC